MRYQKAGAVLAGAGVGAAVMFLLDPDRGRRRRARVRARGWQAPGAGASPRVARDVMTGDPACCSANTTLDEVAKLMRYTDCGEIPIVDTTGRPVGVITDRDIVVRVVAEGMNPVAHTAEQCMTHQPVTVRPDTPLHAVIDTMERHQIRRVPVVDAAGACIGIVAQADIAREAAERSVGELVREVSETPAR